ncbi:MAG: hypothetical protein AAGE43_17850, partial [Pseudomonadota bacterium]
MSVLGSQDEAAAGLLPWPRQIDFGAGSLAVTSQFQPAFADARSPRLEAAVQRLNSELARWLNPSLADAGKEALTLKIRCSS